jgi:arylsulfatase A-like enzyme
MADAAPDLAFIALADVDRNGHGFGPDSPECERAVTEADAAIGRLVDRLRVTERWSNAVLIVTADHGFTALAPSAERPYPVITFGRDLERAGIKGVRIVADGGVEHVYAEDIAADATSVGRAAPTLARVAALAAATPGVAEVLARLPVPGIRLLAAAHPDWHLTHERTGELLLVAAPGHQFVDPWDPEDAALLGNHGGPGELGIPLFLTGGYEGLVAAPADAAAPRLVDVAPTIATLLGVRVPLRVDGGTVSPDLTGRVLASVLRR